MDTIVIPIIIATLYGITMYVALYVWKSLHDKAKHDKALHDIGRDKYQKFLIILITASCVFYAALIIIPTHNFAVNFNVHPESQHIPFSPENWRSLPYNNEDGTFSYARSKMVASLLEQYDFANWSDEQVEDLLGEPDQTKWKNDQEYEMYFDLGNGIDFLIFHIEDSQVADYRVYRH